MSIPLPFTCQHHKYAGVDENEHGIEKPAYAPAVAVICFWWSADSTEPASAPRGGSLVRVDLVLVLDAVVSVDHRDLFTVNGRRFDVVGLPKDYEHGPFGYQPGRQPIELRFVG